MAENWVVLVEAAADGPDAEMTPDDVSRLLGALRPGRYAGALHCPGRYALQLTSSAVTPAQALADVLARWAETVRELGLPAWKVVRTEVITPAELQSDLNQATGVHPESSSEERPRPAH